MIILTIRTDKPEAEIGLFDCHKQLGYETWQAHRQLAETLHAKIQNLLRSSGRDWLGVNGIVCFKGPGSFTGLRIGLTVGNTLAYSLTVPITGTTGDEWIKNGIGRLLAGNGMKLITPQYGGEVFITEQRK